MSPSLKIYIQELRAPFLTASLLPAALGLAAAFRAQGRLAAGTAAACLAAFGLIHLATNVLNDYFDHRSGADAANRDFVRPFSGGSRLIQLGLLSPRQVLAEGLILLAAALGLCLWLAWRGGWPAAGLLGFALASGVGYTAAPAKWVYRGWGELLVGLNLGPVAVAATYLLQTGHLPPAVWLISLPLGFLAAAILFINEFPDYASDLTVGKRTWVVRLGRRKSRWVYAGLLAGAFASLAIGLLTGAVPRLGAAALFTLAPAVLAVQTLWKYYELPPYLGRIAQATIGLHLILGVLLCLTFFIRLV